MRVAALAITVGIVLGLAACKEDAKEGEGVTPTPNPSPTPVTTPIPLTFPGVFTDEITVDGQRDLYSFQVPAGGLRVRLDLDAESLAVTAGFDGRDLDARLTLYGPGGNLLKVVDDGTTVADPLQMRDPFLVYDAVEAGTYTVSVEDANGDGAAAGYDYVLRSAVDAPVALPGGDACSAAVLLTNLDASYAGSVGSGDTNSVGTTVPIGCVGSVVPAKDHVYRAFLDSAQKFQMVRTGTGWDGAIYVVTTCDGALATVAASCAGGGDGSEDADGTVFRPKVTGTHYIYVDGVGANAFGPYELHLRQFAPGE